MTTRSSAQGDKTSKKPISIGAALRQRMTGQSPDVADEVETDSSINETNSRVSSESARETYEKQTSQAALTAVPSQAAQAREQLDDPLESFNTRLRKSLLKRMKVYSAVHAIKIQDLVDVALEQYFTDKKDSTLD